MFQGFHGLCLPFTASPEAEIEEAVAGTAAKSIPEILLCLSCSHLQPRLESQ